MEFKTLFSPTRTIYCHHANFSAKKILDLISKLARKSDPELKAPAISKSLLSRERLGSTNIGNGIAIPHGRVVGLKESMIILMKLPESIHFSSTDIQKVNLIFGLLVPEEAKENDLSILPMLAQKLKDENYLEKLLTATDSETLYKAAIEEN